MTRQKTMTKPDNEPYDPGPEVPDPAPLVGQVGEGATLPSGERIAHTVRELAHDEERERSKRKQHSD